MLRQVNIDGVLYKIGDSRFEGDNLAYIQLPESITVGTPLTDLAPIQKALDSTDGSLLYAPSLNVFFAPTASSTPATTRIWASTTGDKGYQLKATLNESGILSSAVVNEAAAEAGLIITDAEWWPVMEQYLDKDPTDFDPTGTYLITDEAKAIANKLATVEDDEVKSPDKLQIEIVYPNITMLNCVYNAVTGLDGEDGAVMFKTLGGYPLGYDNVTLEFGPKMDDEYNILGLIIKEPSEDDIIIEYTDVATLQSATTDPYTPVTTAAAKEIGEKIFNNPRKRIFVHYNMGAGTDYYQELKPTAPFPVNFESGGNLAYIFADLAEDGYNMCIRVFVGPVDIIGATACPHYMAVSEYALICDNSETTSDPFLTDDVSIWIGKSLGTNCFGLSAAGETNKAFYKCIVDKADFTGTGAKYYDTFTYELDRKFTSPGSGKNYTSLKNINVYYNNSFEVVGILVVDPPKNESVTFNISTEDYDDIEYNTENLTTDPYVTTDLAKSIGKKLLGHFNNPEGFDIDHFTVSKMPTSANAFDIVPISFYTYTDHTPFNDDIAVIKFTTTAEIFNGDITVFYNKSNNTEALGMRIDPKALNKAYLLTAMNYQAIRTAMETVDPAVGYITDADLVQIAKDIYATKDDFDYFDLQWSPMGPSFQYTVIDLFNYDHAPDEAIGIRYGSNCSFGPSNRYETEDIIVYLKPVAGGVNVVGIAASHPLDDLVHQGVEYMEVPTGHAPHTCLEASVSGTTLNITHKNESHISSVIHVPKSVLFTSPNAFELKLAPYGAPYTPAGKIEISKDGINWVQTTWNENDGISLKADTLNNDLGKYSVFIKSDDYINEVEDFFNANCSAFTITSGTNIEVSGILEALWGCKEMQVCGAFCLFSNMGELVSAKNLVLPNGVSDRCYYSTFSYCTKLVSAPECIPAKDLSETFECYVSMFEGCSALINPPILPATTIGYSCYHAMFQDCTALTTTPALPAQTLDYDCYCQMFCGCTSLKYPPVLPALSTTGSCYQSMFNGCTALIVPPELPATVIQDHCYDAMFLGCTSLTTTPELPATVLESQCYEHMFQGCTSLTKPVVFPTLTDNGSYAMHETFKGCTGIKWATSGIPYEIKSTDATPDPGSNLMDMFKGNSGSPLPGGSGTPDYNTTYYLKTP